MRRYLLDSDIEYSDNPAPNRAKLWHAMRQLTLWPFDKIAAEEYGRIYAELRRIGRPMQQIDIQIADVARVLGNCAVVTKDSDLLAVPGLDVEDWSNA